MTTDAELNGLDDYDDDNAYFESFFNEALESGAIYKNGTDEFGDDIYQYNLDKLGKLDPRFIEIIEAETQDALDQLRLAGLALCIKIPGIDEQWMLTPKGEELYKDITEAVREVIYVTNL